MVSAIMENHRFIALFATALAACSGTPAPVDPGDPATGAQGMVSTAHPIATEAGLATLRNGGNAFDAAVTIASTLNVVEPMMSGMGGYGTILVWDAEAGEAHYLDASGKIPLAVDSDVYRSPTPNFQENRRNAKAVSTPGAANAWQAMSTRFGTLAWAELLEPAIRVAKEGFVVDERTAFFIERAFPEFPEHAYCTFEPKGNPMDAHPGRRKLSSDSPSIVLRDGRPWIALGTPGGHTITQTVAQMIMNVVDFDMNIQDAIAAPRIAFNVPNNLDVEESIPEETRALLAAMGHQIRLRTLGNAHGLAIEYDADGKPTRFAGGSDPRGKGLAKGY